MAHEEEEEGNDLGASAEGVWGRGCSGEFSSPHRSVDQPHVSICFLNVPADCRVVSSAATHR